MFCTNCGFNNEDEHKFCMKCGFKLREAAAVPHTAPPDVLPGQPSGQHAAAVPSRRWLLWIAAPLVCLLVLVIVFLTLPEKDVDIVIIQNAGETAGSFDIC